MYPQNIYDETMSKEDCKQITIDLFKPVLDMVKCSKLTNVELYVLEERYVKGRSASEIRYSLGFNNTSQVYHKIRRIITILIENINFRYCGTPDKLSMFIGSGMLKKAKQKDCNIADALKMYSADGYVYHNYYDEVIAYTLLKRFDYPVSLLDMHALRSKEYRVLLYSILYSDGEPEPRLGSSYRYLFIKNIDRVLRMLYSYNDSYIQNIDSLLLVYNIQRDIMAPVFERLHTKHFEKLICDPGCLYTDEYFDYKSPKEIDLSYISVAISPHLYETCVKIVSITKETPSLFKLLYAICSLEFNHDKSITERDKAELNELLDLICATNPGIKEIVRDIREFISTAVKAFT